MKKLFALAALGAALLPTPAHAMTVLSFSDPTTGCTWSVTGPDITVYPGPGIAFSTRGGVRATRTCADPSSNCSIDIERSTTWIADHAVPNVTVEPGDCWV